MLLFLGILKRRPRRIILLRLRNLFFKTLESFHDELFVVVINVIHGVRVETVGCSKHLLTPLDLFLRLLLSRRRGLVVSIE